MSKEDDGKWRYAFYDQDKIFLQNYAAVNVIFRWYAKPLQYLSDMATNLMKNPDYKDKFLRRFSEALQGPLSDENALKVIDELCEELRPEIERDRAHCFTSVSQWEGYVGQFRWFFENGYVANVIQNLREALELTDKEMETYFGWAD